MKTFMMCAIILVGVAEPVKVRADETITPVGWYMLQQKLFYTCQEAGVHTKDVCSCIAESAIKTARDELHLTTYNQFEYIRASLVQSKEKVCHGKKP